MLFKSTVGISVIALSVGIAGCNRPAQETRDEAKETAAKIADATVEAQRQRDAEVSRLNERIAGIEREYLAKTTSWRPARRRPPVASGRRCKRT